MKNNMKKELVENSQIPDGMSKEVEGSRLWS